jgi:hypothetical protein
MVKLQCYYRLTDPGTLGEMLKGGRAPATVSGGLITAFAAVPAVATAAGQANRF